MNIIEIRYQKKDAIAADILKIFLDFVGYYSEIIEVDSISKVEDDENIFFQKIESQIKNYQTVHKSELKAKLLQVFQNHSHIIFYRIKPIKSQPLDEIIKQVLNDFLESYFTQKNNQNEKEILIFLSQVFLEYHMFWSVELIEYNNKNIAEKAHQNFLKVQSKLFCKLENEKGLTEQQQHRLKSALMYSLKIKGIQRRSIKIGDIMTYFKPNEKIEDDFYHYRLAEVLLKDSWYRKDGLYKLSELKNKELPLKLKSKVYFNIGCVYLLYGDQLAEAELAFKNALHYHSNIETYVQLYKILIIRSKNNKKAEVEQAISFLKKTIEVAHQKGFNNLTMGETQDFLNSIRLMILEYYFCAKYKKGIACGEVFVEFLKNLDNKYLNYFSLNNHENNFLYLCSPDMQKSIFQGLAMCAREERELNLSEKLWAYSALPKETISNKDLEEIQKLILKI